MSIALDPNNLQIYEIEGEVEMDLLTWAIIAFVIAVIAGALAHRVARGAATFEKPCSGYFSSSPLFISSHFKVSIL
jgi:hypothetical protein